MNECFYCLDCQSLYYDNHKCPPLVIKRKKSRSFTIKKISLKKGWFKLLTCALIVWVLQPINWNEETIRETFLTKNECTKRTK